MGLIKVEIVESCFSSLTLSTHQVDQLVDLGKRLASDKTWWGSEATNPDRTVIECRSKGHGGTDIRVMNAVGIIVLEDLQIIVQPKIPAPHFHFLLAQTDFFPRSHENIGAMKEDETLWKMVARWSIKATKKVMQRTLLRGYEELEDELPTARGKIIPLPTATMYYTGKFRIQCQFEEFSHDTPINRVLKEAARIVCSAPIIDRALRMEALDLLAGMEDVGVYRESDIHAVLERSASYYRDALVWAKHVIRSTGRSLNHGESKAWCFLIRTPELIESGLRALLQTRMGKERVKKHKKFLPDSTVSINPDLVFEGDLAIGDVKYKLSGTGWQRNDLFQLTAFSNGFWARNAALFDFLPENQALQPSLRLGPVLLTHLPWPVTPSLSPELAFEELYIRVEAWVETYKQPQQPLEYASEA